MMNDPADIKLAGEAAISAINALRREGARVHSITNTVTQNFTANVLLACGVRPSMTVNPVEIEAFVNGADALHVNLGTLDEQRMEAIRKAMNVAHANSLPVVLDPVMVHVSPPRLEFARELLGKKPGIIKLNGDEAKVLDTKDAVCTVTTGKADHIGWEKGQVTVQNGDPLLDRVIGTGCALGALMAALAAHSKDTMTAALAGCLWFSIAGEIAAGKSGGPGSFAAQFLDCLGEVQSAQILERMKVS